MKSSDQTGDSRYPGPICWWTCMKGWYMQVYAWSIDDQHPRLGQCSGTVSDSPPKISCTGWSFVAGQLGPLCCKVGIFIVFYESKILELPCFQLRLRDIEDENLFTPRYSISPQLALHCVSSLLFRSQICFCAGSIAWICGKLWLPFFFRKRFMLGNLNYKLHMWLSSFRHFLSSSVLHMTQTYEPWALVTIRPTKTHRYWCHIDHIERGVQIE